MFLLLLFVRRGFALFMFPLSRFRAIRLLYECEAGMLVFLDARRGYCRVRYLSLIAVRLFSGTFIVAFVFMGACARGLASILAFYMSIAIRVYE